MLTSAVELLGDAHADRFDTAIIVSADSDLSGPIGNVRSQYPVKRGSCRFSAWARFQEDAPSFNRALHNRPRRTKGQSVA